MAFSKSVKRKIKKSYGVKNLAEAEKILQAGYEVKQGISQSVAQAVKLNKQALKQEVINDVMANCLLMELYVEYEKYGSKKLRLRKRLNHLLEMWDLMSEPEKYHLTTQDLNNILINEAKFNACEEIEQNGKDCAADEKRRQALYGSIQKITERCMSVQEAAEYLSRGKKVMREYWQGRGGTPFFIKLMNGRVVDDDGKPYAFTVDDVLYEDWQVVK